MAHNSQKLMTLLEYKRTASGATIFGKTIRVDETGEFSSIEDCIVAISKCSENVAQKTLNSLKAEGIIDNTEPGVTLFEHDGYMILGVRLDRLAYICFHLKSEHARSVTKVIFEIGVRYLVEDQAPHMPCHKTRN
jgi:hypothetical protein